MASTTRDSVHFTLPCCNPVTRLSIKSMDSSTHLRQSPLQACKHAAEQRQQEAGHGKRNFVVVLLTGEQQRNPAADQQNHYQEPDSELLPAASTRGKHQRQTPEANTRGKHQKRRQFRAGQRVRRLASEKVANIRAR